MRIRSTAFRWRSLAGDDDWRRLHAGGSRASKGWGLTGRFGVRHVMHAITVSGRSWHAQGQAHRTGSRSSMLSRDRTPGARPGSPHDSGGDRALPYGYRKCWMHEWKDSHEEIEWRWGFRPARPGALSRPGQLREASRFRSAWSAERRQKFETGARGSPVVQRAASHRPR